jgi:hypothetical protein
MDIMITSAVEISIQVVSPLLGTGAEAAAVAEAASAAAEAAGAAAEAGAATVAADAAAAGAEAALSCADALAAKPATASPRANETMSFLMWLSL